MVMIDEFQDTDQMQVDLIRYLTGAGERALCTVGDAQQSIYRFRGAEVEVFRRQERKVGSSPAPEATAVADAPAGEPSNSSQLPQPYAVLRYVARVFDGDDGGLMQGFLDLEASDSRKDTLVADVASPGPLCCRQQHAGAHTGQGPCDRRAIPRACRCGQPRRHGAAAGPHDQRRRLRTGLPRPGLDCVIAGG